MESFLWALLLQVVLICFNAIFACTEIAVISVNGAKLSKLAEQGNKRALKLSKLTEQPAGFLATIQIAITLSGFLGSAFAAENFSGVFVDWLVGMGVTVPVKTLETAAVIVTTLILSYFTLIFGELVPKRVAMKKAEPFALGIASLIYFISKIFSPVVWLLTVSTNMVLRLIGIDPGADEEEVSEEEIRMMVDVGSEKGVIDVDEKDMIQNIFEFGDTAIQEFVTHRTDLTFLWDEDSVEEWGETIRASRFSQYPICGESVDDVLGVLNAKDYFRLKDKTKENVMENAVKPAVFVPSSIKGSVLFRKMKDSRNHFAVALDEYGGVLGIITMNDLLEGIVGNLDDGDYEGEEAEDIRKTGDDTWIIRGRAHIDDVAKELDVDIESDEYDTLGGMVFGEYGTIPDDGEVFEIDIGNLHIKVLEIKEHSIEKMQVIKDFVPVSGLNGEI